mmetsp:Transcript_44203/g.87182  ORF Transcript_44203/g.87182 Transcript_44203/m.87182 type:complete len:278 (+) Transcript_44203:137-970(+)
MSCSHCCVGSCECARPVPDDLSVSRRVQTAVDCHYFGLKGGHQFWVCAHVGGLDEDFVEATPCLHHFDHFGVCLWRGIRHSLRCRPRRSAYALQPDVPHSGRADEEQLGLPPDPVVTRCPPRKPHHESLPPVLHLLYRSHRIQNVPLLSPAWRGRLFVGLACRLCPVPCQRGPHRQGESPEGKGGVDCDTLLISVKLPNGHPGLLCALFIVVAVLVRPPARRPLSAKPRTSNAPLLVRLVVPGELRIWGGGGSGGSLEGETREQPPDRDRSGGNLAA